MAILIFKFVFTDNSNPAVVLTSTELTGGDAPTINISTTAIADGTVASAVSGGALTYDSYTKSWGYRLASADLATYVYIGMATTTYATASPASVHALGIVIPDELVSSRLAPATAGRTLAVDASGRVTPDTVTLAPSATDIADAVLDEAATGHTGHLANIPTNPYTGLTAQEIADAVNNLAPAGTPAFGSLGAQAAAIKTKTDTLGASSVSIVYPIAQDGTITLEAGDSYEIEEGYELNWIDTGDTWPELTEATIVFKVGTILTLNGTVVVATGTGKKVRVVITKANSALLTQGVVYRYNVRAMLSNGHEITLVKRSRLQVGKSLI